MWQLYALLTVLAIALSVIFQKIAVTGRDAVASTWAFMTIAAIALLPLLDVSKIAVPSNLYIYIFLAGALYTIASIWASKSYQRSDISLIAPIKNFTPVLVLLLSALFLGEAITARKVAGIVLIFVGALALEDIRTPHNSAKKILKDKGMKYIFLTMIAMSLSHIVDKYVLYTLDARVFTVLTYIVIAALLTAYALSSRKIKLGIGAFKSAPLLFIAAGGLEAIAFYLQSITLKMIDVSLFVPLRRTYSLVVIILAHYVLNEKDTKNKIFGAILMIAGVLVLSS